MPVIVAAMKQNVTSTGHTSSAVRQRLRTRPPHRYNPGMPTATETLDRQFLTMRERILSLAADFDRIERATDGKTLLKTDPRAGQLRKAIEIVLNKTATRAEQVQLLLSDTTPAPKRRKVRASE
jgi:hypothetical protein